MFIVPYCPLCFDGRSDHPFHNKCKIGDVYKETIERQQRLQQLGFQLKLIWEHDFRKLKETDEMKYFLDVTDILTYLEPRDAFIGGRVNGFKLFRDAKEGETIEDFDVSSLYPFVIGIGHPEIIRENFQDISNYFGLIKWKVLAPTKLYHPVATKSKLKNRRWHNW